LTIWASEYPAWLSVFDHEDQAEFLSELWDSIRLAESTHELQALRVCLREWQTTARALSDPKGRQILTSAGDDEFVEVGSPT
jgi:hypothetical protein